MKIMTIDERLSRVPDYRFFHGVDELYAHAKRIADGNPDICRHAYIGESQSGLRIPMVSVGEGPTSILLFASPHPNEPIGAMMVYFLLEELVASPEMREGRTWHIIPCIDPDGTRMNEGWFRGPFTLKNYARDFYRPRGDNQVEWTFPIEYKTFKFDRPIPETRALMHAIDTTRPAVMYSLHNSGFGGAYYYISKPLEALYPKLHRIPLDRGVPLSLGEPEAPYCKELYPAIYATNYAKDAYDYFAQFAKGDPAQYMFGGGSSKDYASQVSDPFVLITEVPYFMSKKIGDTSPTGRKRGEVLLEGYEKTNRLLVSAKEIIDATISDIEEGAIFRDTSASFINLMLKRSEGETAWAKSEEVMAQEATVAQEAHALYLDRFYNGLIISMYRRALRAQLEKQGKRGIEGAYKKIDSLVDSLMEEIGQALDYSVIPIRTLIQIQYGALLSVLETLKV